MEKLNADQLKGISGGISKFSGKALEGLGRKLKRAVDGSPGSDIVMKGRKNGLSDKGNVRLDSDSEPVWDPDEFYIRWTPSEIPVTFTFR
jgi:hypothetical protein